MCTADEQGALGGNPETMRRPEEIWGGKTCACGLGLKPDLVLAPQKVLKHELCLCPTLAGQRGSCIVLSAKVACLAEGRTPKEQVAVSHKWPPHAVAGAAMCYAGASGMATSQTYLDADNTSVARAHPCTPDSYSRVPVHHLHRLTHSHMGFVPH